MKVENTLIRPQLKAFDLTLIVISLVIGMGIFRTPAEVAAKAQLPWIFFFAWATGAIVSAIGAITFAEIGSREPTAGGFYKIFSICYSPVFAFMVNWITVISNAVSTAAVAIMGAEYMAPMLFPSLAVDEGIRLVSITSLLVLYGINMLGIKVSSGMLNLLMILKLCLLALIISVPFFIDAPVVKLFPEHSAQNVNWFQAFLLCFVPVFFTYGGYQQTINFGGDVKNPRQTIPKSIMLGIGIVLIVYMSVNFAYVYGLGFEGLQNSKTLAADMVGLLLGNRAHQIVSVLMFLSVMTFVNVSLLSNPRVYYAMAEDKVMPSFFMKVNAKTQVQQFGITFFCAVILIVLFYLASFQRMLSFVMFFDSISIIAAAAAVFILRKREKLTGKMDGVFKMRGYPFLPAFFILIYCGVSVSVMMADPEIFVTGVTLFVLGFPLFHLIQFVLKKK
jgi:basic amino acid/polyamine antiporter, APA family